MGREWQRTRAAPARATHSWNGKYRRPDKLWTPDYRTPMQGNLLWVYEGQTSFWDLVLAARSGMQSKEMVLAEWATNAGYRSEEHTSELQSLMRNSYAVFCLKKKKHINTHHINNNYDIIH